MSPALFDRPGLADDWPEGLARFLERVPLQRVGEIEDIADACLLLASDASRWITGLNMAVDGGILTSPGF